jgi:hypothetical protein
MLDQRNRESLSDPPLDFTQFLSSRLNLDAPATLAALGAFLLEFEPSGTYAKPRGVGDSALRSD